MIVEKERQLRSFFTAFATRQFDVIDKLIVPDFTWTIVGYPSLIGLEAVTKEMKRWHIKHLFFSTIMAHGINAAVEGKLTLCNDQQISFCHTITFHSYKDSKLKTMNSYFVAVTPPSC